MLGAQEPFWKHVPNTFCVRFLAHLAWNATVGPSFPTRVGERHFPAQNLELL